MHFPFHRVSGDVGNCGRPQNNWKGIEFFMHLHRLGVGGLRILGNAGNFMHSIVSVVLSGPQAFPK